MQARYHRRSDSLGVYRRLTSPSTSSAVSRIDKRLWEQGAMFEAPNMIPISIRLVNTVEDMVSLVTHHFPTPCRQDPIVAGTAREPEKGQPLRQQA